MSSTTRPPEPDAATSSDGPAGSGGSAGTGGTGGSGGAGGTVDTGVTGHTGHTGGTAGTAGTGDGAARASAAADTADAAGAGPTDDGAAEAQAAEQAKDRDVLRQAAVTTGWWAHGLVRLLLACAMVYYGVAKLVLGQFGVADMGDALITQGEMSPMGMLWRMVALSPLFQVLAGLAEFGAALALLWRRTVPLGALIAFASMVFVFVLNLGYDVPVKQISLALALMSLIVLIPWVGRLARAILGQGEVTGGRLPTLIPWRPVSRITNIVGPIAALGLVAVLSWGVTSMYAETTADESVPAGVWSVASDTAAPAEQLTEDTRWQQVAFGDIDYEGTSMMQLRLANGELLSGTYERTDSDTVEATLRPLRDEGQSIREHGELEPVEMTLTFEEQSDGAVHVTGDDIDLVLAANPSGRVLYDRESGWGSRPDAPFNR